MRAQAPRAPCAQADEPRLRPRQDGALAEQHNFLRTLHSALRSYGELDAQAQQGAGFYSAMAEQLESLHRRVVDLAQVRNYLAQLFGAIIWRRCAK